MQLMNPQVECIGGPLDGQRMDSAISYIVVPLERTPVNLARWGKHMNDPHIITPITCCSGSYVLHDGHYEWQG